MNSTRTQVGGWAKVILGNIWLITNHEVWGWIFITVGVLCLIMSTFQED